MAVETGYSKIVTSGSVFLYDTGDTVNSWKGAPTTNLATFDVASAVFSTDTPGNLTQTANSTEATYQGRLSKKMTVGAGYWNAYIYNYNTGVSSTVFAVSYKVKLPGGAHPSSIIGGGYIYGSAGSFFPAPTFTSLGDGWYLATMLYSGTSMTLNSLTGMNGTGPGVFYITDYQAEAKSFSTPFAGVAGTRSTTQGMIDIVGGNTIDLANMSYGANNAISFDGTDDYISLGCVSNTIRAYNSSTEFIVNLPVYSGGQRAILSYRSVNTMYIGKASGGIFVYYNTLNTPGYTVGNITNGTTAHIVVLCNADGNLLSVYINGTLAGSVTRTGWSTTYNSTVSLGYDDGGTNEYMLGSMYLFKHYNRVLSSTEIQQNYNHYKTRFNLP